MKKKALSLVCIVLSAVMLCSCGSSTELFGSRGTSPYIKIGDYKNIVVDAGSAEYKEYYETLYFSDVSAKNLYERVDEGAVKVGDYANIDYSGKIDDVAFEGGTDTDYDLLIGSQTFIEGFEDGLVGVSVGETVSLHLKFPQSYGNSDLAGKNAVFDVTVNYIKTPVSIEKAYEDMGFKSLEDYQKDLDDRCVKYFAVKNYIQSCTFKETPDKKMFSGVVMLAYYDDLCRSSYGMDISSYLTGNGQKVNDFAENISEHLAEGQLDGLDEIKTVKNAVLAFYALYEKENFTYNKDKLGKTTGYERCFNEFVLIKDMVSDYLYKNATVKVTETDAPN